VQNKLLNEAKQKLQNQSAQSTAPRYQIDHAYWREVGAGAPDLDYVCDGLETGFDICVPKGIDLSRDKCRNLPTSVEQKISVTNWIGKKRDKGAIWGPWKTTAEMPPVLDGFRSSPMGVVKKGVHANITEEDWWKRNWRVIHHLTHPKSGISVNSSIDPMWTMVSYPRFRQIVAMIYMLGVGALLWTIDAEDAYIRVPINEESFKYMGFQWMGLYYCFTCLSFGLASACKIYTRFADLLLWIVKHNTDPELWHLNGQPCVYHYIDDFFGGAPAQYASRAHSQFDAVYEWFGKLGIPTQLKKCFSPRTRIIILGFLYDTMLQMVFIPEIKLNIMLDEINRILGQKNVTQLELQSLIGKLRWASVCIFMGPAFVRRMEVAAYSVKRGYHHVHVHIIRRDLLWWREQITKGGQGIKLLDILRANDKGDIHVLTDASTKDGMGGWNRQGDWFRYRWTDHPNKPLFQDPKKPDIFWKEMCAIATSCLIWGHQWKGKSVTFWCDNEPCVYSLAKWRCDFRREDVMRLIRIIADCANRFGFCPFFIHIRGKDNLTADSLSRFDFVKFRSDTAGIQMSAAETECSNALDHIVKDCFN